MKTRLGVHAESIRCQITEIDNLKPSLSNNREKLAESKRLLEQEKSDALTKAEKSKEKADVAKSSFEKTRGEVEALLLDFEDLEIQLEVDEIVRAQATMIEETSVKITHLLNGKRIAFHDCFLNCLSHILVLQQAIPNWT